MGQWTNYFFNLALLKIAPQDAPNSIVARNIAVAMYWFLGLAILLFTQTLFQSVLLASVQTVLLIFLTQVSLWIRKNPERLTQTITGLMGSTSVIMIVALPIIFWANQPGFDASSVATVLWLALLIWETFLTGHIFKHALDVPFIAGIGLAMVFMYMTFAITFKFIKVMAFSSGT